MEDETQLTPVKEYDVQVVRVYTVCETFPVAATSRDEARQLAIQMSDSKDYVGSIKLTDIEVDVLEELEI